MSKQGAVAAIREAAWRLTKEGQREIDKAQADLDNATSEAAAIAMALGIAHHLYTSGSKRQAAIALVEARDAIGESMRGTKDHIEMAIQVIKEEVSR